MGSLTKGTMYLMIAQAVFLASTYLMQVGLGRFLGPELYGVYGVIMALITAVTLMLTSGMEQAISKKVSEKRELAYTIKNSVLKLEFAFSIIFAIIYFASAELIANLLNDASLVSYIRFSSLIIPVYCIGKVYSGYFDGLQQFKKHAFLLTIFSIARLLFVFALAYIFLINGVIVGMIVASFISLIAAIIISEKGKKYSMKIRELIIFAIPVTMFNLAFTLLFSIDLFLVKALLQENMLVGYYNASVNLARSLYFLLSALALVLLPAISEAVTKNKPEQTKRLIKESMRYVFMCLIPLCILMSVTSKNLVALFYQARYLPAATPLSILVFGSAFLTIFFILATVLMGAGNPKLPMMVVILLVFIDFILNLVLIPQYSLAGAAIATTLTSIIGAIILSSAVVIRFGMFTSLKSLMKILLASLVVYVIASLIPTINKFLLPAEYALLAMVYLGVLLLLKEVTKEDIRRIKSLIPKSVSGFLPLE